MKTFLIALLVLPTLAHATITTKREVCEVIGENIAVDYPPRGNCGTKFSGHDSTPFKSSTSTVFLVQFPKQGSGQELCLHTKDGIYLVDGECRLTLKAKNN